MFIQNMCVDCVDVTSLPRFDNLLIGNQCKQSAVNNQDIPHWRSLTSITFLTRNADCHITLRIIGLWRS